MLHQSVAGDCWCRWQPDSEWGPRNWRGVGRPPVSTTSWIPPSGSAHPEAGGGCQCASGSDSDSGSTACDRRSRACLVSSIWTQAGGRGPGAASLPVGSQLKGQGPPAAAGTGPAHSTGLLKALRKSGSACAVRP
jgi:hypothetical protein